MEGRMRTMQYGIGHSGLPSHYGGFNIQMSERRQLFNENLDVMQPPIPPTSLTLHAPVRRGGDAGLTRGVGRARVGEPLLRR